LSPALNQALSTLTAYGVIIIGTVVALNMMGVDLTLLAVVAGGLSVGLGFGLQEVVSNFVSGFILMFEQSIGPGDVIEVGDDVGIVQTIGVRSTIIRNRDNVELIIPNSRLLSETVTNLTRSDQQVRIRISVGVTYSADPQAVKQALLEAVQHPFVSEQPAPSIQFRDFGDSSLTFDLLVWTDKAFQSLNLASDLRYQIWDALKAHNIEIPFPQRDIHIRSGVPWQELIQNGQHMSF
ncbi:MAG: mechanosensitive ion channel, partial [Phycisphaerae bacterium]|nr:mechanosensitive ion channel [Phycisphaerae bacterium]